jgi:hypothetical protein
MLGEVDMGTVCVETRSATVVGGDQEKKQCALRILCWYEISFEITVEVLRGVAPALVE